jgi:hypothetical protein
MEWKSVVIRGVAFRHDSDIRQQGTIREYGPMK